MANAPAPYASASLYVGDLVPDVTEANLFEVFNAVGPVASVRVCRDATSRRSLGYAYVNFHRVEDAERSLEIMNFKTIKNQPCRIMWSHRDPQLRRSGVGNIFVKNLAKSIDNKQLYDTFSIIGNILSCKVCLNTKGEPLGYGFVHYESDQAANTAILRVNNKVIGGQQVSVQPFKPKNERQSEKQSKATNVFIKNIPSYWTVKDLTAFFEPYGTVDSVFVSVPRELRDNHKFKDHPVTLYGFCNFSKPEEAIAAIQSLNGTVVKEDGGRDLIVFVARAMTKEERYIELMNLGGFKEEQKKKAQGSNLYVKNLPPSWTDSKLRDEFARFGEISSVKVEIDSNKVSKGFGFVSFVSEDSAKAALAEMTGRMVESKPLYVALHQTRAIRQNFLEQQASFRQKMNGPYGNNNPQMYQQAQQMYPYQQMVPPRFMNMPYPQQHNMINRSGWQQQGAPGMVPRNTMGYQLQQQIPQQARLTSGARQPGIRGGRGGSIRPGGPTGKPQGPGGYASGVPRTQPRPEAAFNDDISAKPLTISALAAAPEEQQKQMIGEKLFPQIRTIIPELAGKITGMLLEMDNGELLHLLESRSALEQKVEEARAVLSQANDDN